MPPLLASIMDIEPSCWWYVYFSLVSQRSNVPPLVIVPGIPPGRLFGDKEALLDQVKLPEAVPDDKSRHLRL